MPTPSLIEFAQAIPVCEQTSGFADLLEIFRSSGCETIAVVNSQHCPLGVVNLPKVLPHLLLWQQQGKTPVEIAARNEDKPLSELEPPIIEPLAILPAQMSLSHFWSYLQESGHIRAWELSQEWALTPVGTVGELDPLTTGLRPATLTSPHSFIPSSRQHWALVNEQGKFLGLLNSWLVLKSLASQFTKNKEQPQPPDLKPLIQLLEHLPLPLSIQTATGQVLAQNLMWRTQIGTSPNLDWVRRTTAAMLDFPSEEPGFVLNNSVEADGSVAMLREEAKTPCESLLSVPNIVKEQCKVSAQAATQRFCAIDTPRLAAAVSTQQVILAPPSSKTQESRPGWERCVPTAEMVNKSQERVFSFVKIPLPSAMFLGATAGEWDEEQDLRPSSYLPDLSDLCVVLAQDTTEQQQVAKELAAKNADLVHLNRLKDEFLACISHELKTPLTAVLGLSTLLKDQALGTLNERQARYARLIYQSGRQLMTLVNDILDLTRMETGQLELTLEPVQIQSVCDRAYSQAQQCQHEKDQEDEATPERRFTLEIEPDLEMIVADELRLRQMLMHLLANALKFTDTDGEIGLKVNRWEGWIAFTVWDTGIGIPPDKQHLIFQKFQQLEQPLTRRFEGTGLGLVLTQRLARLHGGDISFISKLGEGSQFTLLLPPCPPQGRGTQEEILECPLPLPQCPVLNRLVLIVETVPCYLDSLTEQLKSLGYRVVIARSGTEAIAKARGLQPRAILINPLLPQLSGWDVLTLLKSDSQTRHIPVLVTATQAEKQQAYQNKADGFLNLPVQKQDLQQSLTGLEEQNCPIDKGLTILHLSPVETGCDPSGHPETSLDPSVATSDLTDILSVQNSELNYRVLEADDLDQAELLARVWQPDVVLLDSRQIADSFAYLQQFSLHPNLVALPLVTLDRRTTEAANQVNGLSVYPCLASDGSSKTAALLQVLQVGAGMTHKPSILVMDMGEQEVKAAMESHQAKIESSQCPKGRSHPLGTQCVSFSDRPQMKRSAGSKPKKSKAATPAAPQSSWLQAMMQYLQTAGFRSVFSCSWTEIYSQLQAQSVDLLLIRLKDSSDSTALIDGLIPLTRLQTLPPIIILDHRSNANPSDSTPHLDSLLKVVATQILPGHSLSMTQLLDRINQVLGT